MTDERRVEVAAEALEARAQSYALHRSEVEALARAVVAALDAHDGDLRERLAGAVEARTFVRRYNGSDEWHAGWAQACADAARIIRERP